MEHNIHNLSSPIYGPIYRNVTPLFFQCHSCLSLLKPGSEGKDWGEQAHWFSTIFYNQVLQSFFHLINCMDRDISVQLIKLNPAKIIGYACRVNMKFQSSKIHQLQCVLTNQMQIIYSSLVKSSSGENQLI